jgi:hypothetical protein
MSGALEGEKPLAIRILGRQAVHATYVAGFRELLFCIHSIKPCRIADQAAYATTLFRRLSG